MAAAKQRPKIKSITVELEDGRKKVIQGTDLEDPDGGTLVWNDFGAKKVMKAAYKERGEDKKAKKTEEIWDGTYDPNVAELPAVMIKPQCDPGGWPP